MSDSRSPYYSSYEYSSADLSFTDDIIGLEDKYKHNRLCHTSSTNRDSLYRESNNLDFRNKKFNCNKFEVDNNEKHKPITDPWGSIYKRIIKAPKVTSLKEIGMRIHSVIANSDPKSSNTHGFTTDLIGKFDDFSQINLNSKLKKIKPIQIKKKRIAPKTRISTLTVSSTHASNHLPVALKEKATNSSSANNQTHNLLNKHHLKPKQTSLGYKFNAQENKSIVLDISKDHSKTNILSEKLADMKANQYEKFENNEVSHFLMTSSTHLPTTESVSMQPQIKQPQPSNLKNNLSIPNSNTQYIQPLNFLSKLQKGDLNKVKQRSNFFNDILFEAIKEDLAKSKQDTHIYEEAIKEKETDLMNENSNSKLS